MTPSCQFFPSASSSCLRRPTVFLHSPERGPLWLCVEAHLGEQDTRDCHLLAVAVETSRERAFRERAQEDLLCYWGFRL